MGRNSVISGQILIKLHNKLVGIFYLQFLHIISPKHSTLKRISPVSEVGILCLFKITRPPLPSHNFFGHRAGSAKQKLALRVNLPNTPDADWFNRSEVSHRVNWFLIKIEISYNQSTFNIRFYQKMYKQNLIQASYNYKQDNSSAVEVATGEQHGREPEAIACWAF